VPVGGPAPYGKSGVAEEAFEPQGESKAEEQFYRASNGLEESDRLKSKLRIGFYG
jgi:hypothetical protein